MPPKVKITRKMILDASFDIIQNVGHENLNARTIAKYLNCSTQPILYNFKTIDEIRETVYQIIDEYHSTYIIPKGTDENPMLTMGLNYVRFGYEEKNCFRFLFQTNKFGDIDMKSLIENPALSDVISVMANGLDCNEDQAKEMFLTFFAVTHGLASLLANNTMEYNEEQTIKILQNVFYGMLAIGKGLEK